MTAAKEEAAAASAARDAARERDRLQSKAYGKATQDLRAAHRDEFQDLMRKRAAEYNVDWKPRATEEERAEEQMRKLLSDHPALAQKWAESMVPSEVPDPYEGSPLYKEQESD